MFLGYAAKLINIAVWIRARILRGILGNAHGDNKNSSSPNRQLSGVEILDSLFDTRNAMELFSKLFLSSLSVFFLSSNVVSAFGRKPTIDFKAGNGSLLLASRASSVNVILDGADWPGVLRAGYDLALDFGRVTGLNGSVTANGKGHKSAATIFNVTGIPKDWSVGAAQSNGTSTGTIIAGTIGNSSLIDALIKSGKIDVSEVEGQWEAFVSVVVKNPTNGTNEALVIAGKFDSSRCIHLRE
jgi:hypothetical protein